MEFWGAEVVAGKPLTVKPNENDLIHISQASIDWDPLVDDVEEVKRESVVLSVKVGEEKLVIGTLTLEKTPQINFDLVFEKEFEISHNRKKGSIHFIGYRSPNVECEEEDDESSDEEEEEEEEAVPATVTADGNPGATAVPSVVVKAENKPKAVPVEVKPESDESSSEEEEIDDSSDDDDILKMDIDEDEVDTEEDSEEEEEEIPKQPEPINKKRANESASKTPVSAKKAKQAVTPQKTEEKKKVGHAATPHPAKKGGKSPQNANQSPKGQSSAGASNKKQFNNSGKQGGASNNKGKGKGKGKA